MDVELDIRVRASPAGGAMLEFRDHLFWSTAEARYPLQKLAYLFGLLGMNDWRAGKSMSFDLVEQARWEVRT